MLAWGRQADRGRQAVLQPPPWPGPAVTLPPSPKHLTGRLLPLGDTEWSWFSAKWLHATSAAAVRAFGVRYASSRVLCLFSGLFGLSAGWSPACRCGPWGAALGLFASSLGPLAPGASWVRMSLQMFLGCPWPRMLGVGDGASSSFLLEKCGLRERGRLVLRMASRKSQAPSRVGPPPQPIRLMQPVVGVGAEEVTRATGCYPQDAGGPLPRPS